MLVTMINDAIAQEKLRRAIQATPAARQQGLKEIAGAVMRQIVTRAPRDTNAYANAWAQGGNQVGLGPLPMPALNPHSKLKAMADRRLEAVRYWQRIVDSNAAKGRTGKWPTDAIAKLAAAKADLVRLAALNVGRVTAPAPTGNMAPDTVTATVVNDGGSGEAIQVGDRSYYRITNREKHARGVEARTRLVRDIREPFRKLGLSGGATKGFIARLAIASGLASAVPTGRSRR